MHYLVSLRQHPFRQNDCPEGHSDMDVRTLESFEVHAGRAQSELVWFGGGRTVIRPNQTEPYYPLLFEATGLTIQFCYIAFVHRQQHRPHNTLRS